MRHITNKAIFIKTTAIAIALIFSFSNSLIYAGDCLRPRSFEERRQAINNLFGSMADEGMPNEDQALIAKDLIAAHIHAIKYKGRGRITDKINKSLGDTAHIEVIAAEVTDDECIILDFRLKHVKRIKAGRPKPGPSKIYRSTYVADKASEIIKGQRGPLYKLQEEKRKSYKIGPTEIEAIAGGNNLRVLTKIPGKERPTFFFDIGDVVVWTGFKRVGERLHV